MESISQAFNRRYRGSLDPTDTCNTLSDLDKYIASNLAYEGQQVYCKEDGNHYKVYKLAGKLERVATVSGGSIAAYVTGAASTIINDDLTTERALVSDVDGKVAVSLVTSTELGYLTGVTSNIQTQIDNLSLLIGDGSLTGDVDLSTERLIVTGGTDITASLLDQTITIKHDTFSTTDPANGDYVTGLTVSNGHVTAITYDSLSNGLTWPANNTVLVSDGVSDFQAASGLTWNGQTLRISATTSIINLIDEGNTGGGNTRIDFRDSVSTRYGYIGLVSGLDNLYINADNGGDVIIREGTTTIIQAAATGDVSIPNGNLYIPNKLYLAANGTSTNWNMYTDSGDFVLRDNNRVRLQIIDTNGGFWFRADDDDTSVILRLDPNDDLFGTATRLDIQYNPDTGTDARDFRIREAGGYGEIIYWDFSETKLSLYGDVEIEGGGYILPSTAPVTGNSLIADSTSTTTWRDAITGVTITGDGTVTSGSWSYSSAGVLTIALNANDGSSSTTNYGATAGQIPYTNSSTNNFSYDTLYWDETNNRLGVNQSSPTYTLHVQGTFFASSTAYFNSNLYAYSGSSYLQMYSTGSAGVIQMNSAGTENIYMQPSSGYVGIGYTAGATLNYPLEVDGSVNADGWYYTATGIYFYSGGNGIGLMVDSLANQFIDVRSGSASVEYGFEFTNSAGTNEGFLSLNAGVAKLEGTSGQMILQQGSTVGGVQITNVLGTAKGWVYYNATDFGLLYGGSWMVQGYSTGVDLLSQGTYLGGFSTSYGLRLSDSYSSVRTDNSLGVQFLQTGGGAQQIQVKAIWAGSSYGASGVRPAGSVYATDYLYGETYIQSGAYVTAGSYVYATTFFQAGSGLYYGTDSVRQYLDLSTAATFKVFLGDPTAVEVLRVNSTGILYVRNNIIGYSTVITSDERLKEIQSPYDNLFTKEIQGQMFDDMIGVRWNWKDHSRKGHFSGVGAQTIQKYMPWVVQEVDDLDGGSHLSVNYDGLFMPVFNEIGLVRGRLTELETKEQQQDREIEELRQRVKELEDDLSKI